MVGFHSAYRDGRIVRPPDDYLDLILIPQSLGIDPLRFMEFPPMLQAKIRKLLLENIANGWTGNTDMIKRRAANG